MWVKKSHHIAVTKPRESDSQGTGPVRTLHTLFCVVHYVIRSGRKWPTSAKPCVSVAAYSPTYPHYSNTHFYSPNYALLPLRCSSSLPLFTWLWSRKLASVPNGNALHIPKRVPKQLVEERGKVNFNCKRKLFSRTLYPRN